jgi:chloramphenicol 3-O phosphotransferase
VIVLLNGTSSAGKSTLAAEVQDVAEVPFLELGIDTVVFGLPRRYLNDPERWAEVFRYEYDDGGGIAGVVPGPFGEALVAGLHDAVAAMARHGVHVLVDHVLLDAGWAAGFETACAGLDVLRVAVRCPPEVLAERERDRGDRTVGQAEAQLATVHEYVRYDVEVDTSRLSPTEAAAVVVGALEL